jgi:hypothetical protein
MHTHIDIYCSITSPQLLLVSRASDAVIVGVGVGVGAGVGVDIDIGIYASSDNVYAHRPLPHIWSDGRAKGSLGWVRRR